MSDPYAFWKSALAGEKPNMSPDFPQFGFYRMRSKNRQTGAVSWRPVVYYPSTADGAMCCMIGGDEVSEDRGREAWTWCGQFPVTEEAWREVAEKGGIWPDQDSIVAAQIGDNSGSVDDIEVLTDQIKSAADGKNKYLKITNKQQSQQAQSLRSRLLELAGQATKAKKTKADPLYKEWKEVNAKWNPIIEEAELAATLIKKAVDRFLTTLLEAQKVAAGSEMMTDAPAPVPTRIIGAYGRAASAKPVWVIDEITDYDALYSHFKNAAAVKETLEKLARGGVKDGDVPGVKRKEVIQTR